MYIWVSRITMMEPESPESGCHSYFLSEFYLQRSEELSFGNAIVMEDDRILKSNLRFLQQCTVCGSDTFNSFYGAICCDPCRTFFRRHALTQRVRNVKFKHVSLDNSSLLSHSCVRRTKNVPSSLLKEPDLVVGVDIKDVWLQE